MIHVVFNEADASKLHQAIEMDESMQGEIVFFSDDYSIGPIQNIYSEYCIAERKQWWNNVLMGGDFEPSDKTSIISDSEKVQTLIEKLKKDEHEQIWIWAAQNHKDVCGYYWLLPAMKAFQGRVQILYLNNLPFINEKGNIFYPTTLQEIIPKEFIKAKKLARDITLSEFEVDPDEWSKLCQENKGVRLLEGGKKIIQFEVDYFDSELKKYIMPDWQKSNKIIHHFISKSKHHISEGFLLWRLKEMISQNLYAFQGKLANMRDFEIKYHSKEAS